MNEQDKLLPVYGFDSISQAELLLDMFKKQNIFAVRRLFEDSAYDGIYKLQYGTGEIFVRKKDLNMAKNIIKEFMSIYKKHAIDKELKALKEDIFEKGKNFNKVYCATIGILFSIIGFYIMVHSPYKMLSIVFFLVATLFFLVFYMLCASTGVK